MHAIAIEFELVGHSSLEGAAVISRVSWGLIHAGSTASAASVVNRDDIAIVLVYRTGATSGRHRR
jgi:hypothetical protein